MPGEFWLREELLTKTSVIFRLLLSLIVIILISISTVQADYPSQTSIPGYACYRDSISIIQSLETLENDYPELVQLSIIGISWEEQPIYALKLTNQLKIEPKPRLVLVSGLRANAFAPVELSLRFAEELLANYGKYSENGWLLDHFEIHLIVLANPDGRAKAETQALNGDDITWQNNTHDNCPSQDIGVRLNHNFPYEWRASEAGACDSAYAGGMAASEPETQTVISYLQDLTSQPEKIMLLNLDSYQNEILSPYLSSPTGDNPHLTDLYTLAEKIGYNTLSVPIPQGDPDHQPSYGTLIDYAYGTLNIPSLVFSMGYESAGGYSSYCWYFNDNLIEQNVSALIRALKVSADPYHQIYGPEIEINHVSQDINSVNVEGSANDFETWFKGADVYSQVESVKFSVDLPPWHPDATLFPITDLTQDSQSDWTSHFTLEIDYSIFSPGDHRIFFQAWDKESDGNPSNPGLVSAIDVFIPCRLFLPMITLK